MIVKVTFVSFSGLVYLPELDNTASFEEVKLITASEYSVGALITKSALTSVGKASFTFATTFSITFSCGVGVTTVPPGGVGVEVFVLSRHPAKSATHKVKINNNNLRISFPPILFLLFLNYL